MFIFFLLRIRESSCAKRRDPARFSDTSRHVPNGTVNQSEGKGKNQEGKGPYGTMRSHERRPLLRRRDSGSRSGGGARRPSQFPAVASHSHRRFCGLAFASWKARYCTTARWQGWPNMAEQQKKNSPHCSPATDFTGFYRSRILKGCLVSNSSVDH